MQRSYMLKLTVETERVFIIIGIVISIVLAAAAFVDTTNFVSAQNVTSSLKQKALKTLGSDNNTKSSNMTVSSLKAADMIRNMTNK
jgi:hypothetical protein